MPPGRGTPVGRAILERRTQHVPDTRDDTEILATVVRTGFLSALAVPMLREGTPIGAVAVGRMHVRKFTDAQIGLLQTFADQAVNAIENVRLFTELQEKNKALTQAHATVTESLEQQTATSEVLRVISSAPTERQPVFDTIAQSAVRLCDAMFGAVYRVEGGQIHMVAQTGIGAEGLARALRIFPMPLGESAAVAAAIFDRSAVQVSDIEAPQAPRL